MRHRHGCQSATHRPPRIGVSEQTDDVSHSDADDAAAVFRHSLVSSDVHGGLERC